MPKHLAAAIIALNFLAPPASQATPFTPNVIYGEDNRVDYYQLTDAGQRRLADATVALMRSSVLEQQGDTTVIHSAPYGSGTGMCQTEPFYDQETAAFCSGFLITPDTIVTAGHCVSSQEGCAQTRFVFGFRLNHADGQPHQVPTNQIFNCKELVHTVSLAKGEDFAVVRLDRAVTFTAPLTYRTQGAPQIGDALEVMGHPAGLPLKVAAGANIRAVNDSFLTANLDTYGGNSGSAVFSTATGKVEGVLVRGEIDFVYKDGCRVSNVCPADGCRGEDVTLFSRVLPYLH